MDQIFHGVVPFSLACLVAAAIIVIGVFYLVSPARIMATFGLRLLAAGADTLAWLRLKGSRDIVSGLVLLVMMLSADARIVGIVLLVLALIPLGDMSVVLISGGRKSTAFSVHGVTCAAMLVSGLLLIRTF